MKEKKKNKNKNKSNMQCVQIKWRKNNETSIPKILILGKWSHTLL